jgi:sugar phosphate isomerase/epimerase
MKTIKGPGIFLAQFVGAEKPFNNLKNICEWASNLGYKAVQIPTWEEGLIDLKKASESKTYCDELNGIVNEAGLEISELSTHLQGQLVASHYAYDKMFDAFAPKTLHGNVKGRTEWAIDQLKYASNASKHLGLTEMATFSGSLLFHTMYPWPQRPNGLVESGFKELAKRWEPILNHFDKNGVDVCYEIHPGEDLHDGVTFERFLKATNNHSRVKILITIMNT